MRDLIEARIYQLWLWHGPDDHGRWYPVKETIVRAMGIDPMTKNGKKVVRVLELDTEGCRNIVRGMGDVELVDLFQLTVARCYQQRG